MKRWVCGLLRVLGLASWLCAGPAHAAETPSESPPEALEKAGALLATRKAQCGIPRLSPPAATCALRLTD